ncbi:MAG: NADH-quinone oxidoreductase subunit NuoN [Bosea sp.]|nr:NADH-quinone oxidoreductase subunit NuoN [Bosea sp. (in: a-proteobacteria)]
MTAMAAVPDLMPALPELILAVGALAMVLIGAIQGERSLRLMEIMAVVLFAIVGVVLLTQTGKQVTFNGAFVADGFARFMKLLTLVGAAAAIIMSADYIRREGMARFEFPILVVLSTIGMMMMISANDLIALYLGLELQSLALYVVAAMNRDDARSSEAGLKFFVLGALSSGMLLYGMSLVYGFTGTVSFEGIAAALSHGGAGGHSIGIGLVFGLVFISAGLAFKLSAVPFHMWTPDVYEGSPTPVTAFFAAAPKMAAMALTVRVFVGAFPGAIGDWRQIIIFVALASMLLGSFAAIGQRNIKRLMAYSSIGHMGFALVGLAAGTVNGVQGVAVYMAIYLVMTLGTFACILCMRRNGQMVEDIEELGGLSQSQPFMAFCLAMLLFSLAGIPPLAGFFAKFYVFTAAIDAKLYYLAVIGVLSSVVSCYYYLRIVKIMYFDPQKDGFEAMTPALKGVLAISSAAIFVFWLIPGPLVAAAHSAARSLF